MVYNLERFINAQEQEYSTALREIQNGKKQSHWMWYIFPQLAGLGHSDTAKYYAIEDKGEAEAYMNDPVLRERLIEISKAVLAIEGKTANEIFGSPDDMKLKSCMSLFASIENTDPVFKQVLDKYYGGNVNAKDLPPGR